MVKNMSLLLTLHLIKIGVSTCHTRGSQKAIIIASKKYKIAYSKKRTGWTDDIFKWQHTIQPGVPIDLKEYFLRTIFLEILIFLSMIPLYIT
jgi:hypothetical protein